MKKVKKEIKGITLIALVVTIIVLLILASVAISLTIGNNGIFTRAENAVDRYEIASKDEQDELNKVVNFIDDYNRKDGDNSGEDQEDTEIGREETNTQWNGPLASGYETGNGTSSDPYMIDNESQLAYLAKMVNEGETYENTYFILVSYIDLSSYEWIPIGNNSQRYFEGLFDFSGHEISNLTIENVQYDYRGLFGNVGQNAEIKNGGIRECNIKGNNYVGAIAGKNQGKITAISVMSGLIEGKENVGGVAGYNSGTITDEIIEDDVVIETSKG